MVTNGNEKFHKKFVRIYKNVPVSQKRIKTTIKK